MTAALDLQHNKITYSAPTPLAPYYGGKSQHLGAIIAGMINKIPHKIYIEPCGGMFSVLNNKRPCDVEVYSDLDNAIVNLLSVVRNPDQCQRLLELLELTPYARGEWRNCYYGWEAETDPIEKARQVYVVLAQNFVGETKDGSWSCGGPKTYNVARTFYNGLDNIKAISARLRNVLIECQDVFKLIERWGESKQAVWYFDPPYLPEVRAKSAQKNYKHELTPGQHLQLLTLATGLDANVFISGYKSDMYQTILEKQHGWTRYDFSSTASSMMQTVGNKRKGLAQGDTKRTECLWLNPLAASYQNKQLNLF